MGDLSEGIPERSRVPWIWFLPLLAFLAVTVLLMTWPWAKTFATGVIFHWDPPFHAWKLEFAARQILEGRLLPPEGNTNMYYPYTGAFYFEALHWPQAVFAALLFGLTDAGSVLVYHVTLVFFWALSGACFWALLRAMGAASVAAFVGALLFTLMPYRIAYRVEFNMQLCFAIPLFYFFLVRYFQRPNIGYACGLAVAWWLQATSELYQAVFLLLMLPFPALALMSGRWTLLRSWHRFWAPLSLAALVGGILSFFWLWPYLVMLNSHTLSRGLDEIKQHILEPLSYFVSYGTSGLFNGVNARHDEMSTYPTLVLILLTSVFLVYRWMDRRRGEEVCSGRHVLRMAWASTLILFAVIAVVVYHYPTQRLSPLYSRLPVLSCLLSLLLMVRVRCQSVRGALMDGLFAAAVFSFFMGFGPEITSKASHFACPNRLFLELYEWLGVLHGFRVVSRFSFFVLFWMALAASFAIERLLQMRGCRRVAAVVALSALCPVFVYESLPTRDKIILPLPTPLQSPVLDGLERLTEPYVLAMVPLGRREEDSQHMLQIARHDRLSVYAWGGAYPHYTQSVLAALNPRSEVPSHEAAELLRQLWPECLILEDKLFSRRGRIPVDYAKRLAGEGGVLDEDPRFTLLRLNPSTEPSVERIRLIRHDYLVRNPEAIFSVVPGDPQQPGNVWLDLNGTGVGRFPLTGQGQTFRVVLPSSLFVKYAPNRLRFRSDVSGGLVLQSFHMQPIGPDSPTVQQEIPLPMGWTSIIDQLPDTGFKLGVAYPGGLVIHGVDPPPAVIRAGDTFRMRYYVQLPKKAGALTRISLCAGFTREGSVVFENGKVLGTAVDSTLFLARQGKSDIYVLDMPVVIPKDDSPDQQYGLAVTIRDGHGRRVSGRDQAGQKVRRIHLPFPLVLNPSADSAL